ncbi:hypothetical protein [Pseudonocardia sp. ICBG1142]|uniref:hypothetical protein n=1 Tax=Pseudonocardia sp. ICBG1142 TaxID=2846760 RepID=UPI001CF6CAA8|nr:hypothetical protein [Pseudonocardia sp. ICBG1142]
MQSAALLQIRGPGVVSAVENGVSRTVRVVISTALSRGRDLRYVVVDVATGDVIDDAQGYGYKSVHDAYRAHGCKSVPPKRDNRRDVVKRVVKAWCAAHPEFMADVERMASCTVKDGEPLTQVGVERLLAEHGLELPFSVGVLMRHW